MAESCTKADEYSHNDAVASRHGITRGPGDPRPAPPLGVDAGEIYGLLVCRACLGRTLVDDEIYISDEWRRDRDGRMKSGHFDSFCGDRWRAVGTFREFIFTSVDQV